MPKRMQLYEGGGVEVSFDPNICIHAGECVRGLPSVFDVKLKRWIRPENAPAERVADQVRRCPSGALQFRLPSAD